MKYLLYILLFFFTLNVNSSIAQICMSYSYIDSICMNSDDVYHIQRIDTCIDNICIQKIYIDDIFGNKLYVFVDSICYVAIIFYDVNAIKSDNIISYLNNNFIKKDFMWYGKNNEVIDFTYVSEKNENLNINVWVLTIIHTFLIKY